MHIYGAYPAKEDMALSDPSIGFDVHGPAPDSLKALQPHRVMLAALRFGAGVKGKILDAWQAGIPVVTTAIGAEGMFTDALPFGGKIGLTPEELSALAVEFHENEEKWQKARLAGRALLENEYNAKLLAQILPTKIAELKSDLDAIRSRNFTSQMLAQQAFRSTKYFSKWIELKNSVSKSGPL